MIVKTFRRVKPEIVDTIENVTKIKDTNDGRWLVWAEGSITQIPKSSHGIKVLVNEEDR